MDMGSRSCGKSCSLEQAEQPNKVKLGVIGLRVGIAHTNAKKCSFSIAVEEQRESVHLKEKDFENSFH